MKKMYLMKGMAVIACGLVVASCNKADTFNPYADQEAKEQEFKNNFESNVMGGRSIDANQTWSTAKAVQVTVNPRQSGTLKIYTENPIGNLVAPLYTANVTAGSKTTFTIAKPADITTLYAAVLDNNSSILDVMPFAATAEKVSVDLNLPNVSAANAQRRALPQAPTFRDDAPAMPTKYSNTVPANAKYAKDYQNYQKGDVIYVNTAYSSLNNPQNIEDLTIYVDGNVTYYGQTNQNGNGTTFCVTQNSTLKLGAVSERLTVYLAPGATLDVSEALDWQGLSYTDWTGAKATTLTFTKENAALYMSAGSKVIGGNLYFKDGYTVLNEGGTIETTNLHVENGAILYNKNVVKASAAIELRNTKGEIVNDGELTGASMDLDAGAYFHNLGTTRISGHTKLTNTNSRWMNDGKFYSKTFEVTGGNGNAIAFNNCYMEVEGQFHMNEGYFVMNGGEEAGASVVCGSFYWHSNNYFKMGSKSLLKVKGDLLAEGANSGGYGFYGEGDEYAVIQANAITINSVEQFRIAYFKNLFVATDNHFAQGYKDAPNTNQPYYYYDTTVKFSKTQDTAPVSIKPGDCNPGYNYNPSTPEEPKEPEPEDPVMYYYYAFEDLGTTDDFDFNDVVVRVSAPVNGTSTVQLMAAGGTMATVVTYGTENVRNLGNEVHAQFGVDVSTMVNTDRGATKEFVNIGTIEGLSSTTDMSNLPIGITVTGNNGQLTRVTRSVENNGKAPLVIVVSGYPSGENAGKWFWTKERVNISTGYTQFGAWGANASSNNDWYQNYAEGQVHTW